MCIATRISFKSCILLPLFSLWLVRQVSPRACYVCESGADEPCFDNVNNGDFQYDCAKTIDSKTIDGSFEHLRTLIKEYSTECKPGSNCSFDCVTIIGRTVDKDKIVRGCIPKSKHCSDVETPLIFSGFLTDSCERCDTDLCNWHSPTKVTRLVTTFKHTESYAKAPMAEAKRLSSLAKAMKFDYRIGSWCAVVLLVSTFF